jgi:hypothetical protein
MYLKDMLQAMLKSYKRLLDGHFDFDQLYQEMLDRGKYACSAALIESTGHSINVTHARNFHSNADTILKKAQHHVNTSFDVKPFEWNKATGKYVAKQNKLREWVKSLDPEIAKNWLLTDKGALSLSHKAFKPWFSSKSEDSFGCVFTSYLKTQSSLRGFTTVGKIKKPGEKSYTPLAQITKRDFWDTVGSDGRSRPGLGMFGSQTARSQSSMIASLFLKAKWMRCFIEPPEGQVYIGVDYSSQEFLITGLLAHCQGMIDSYQTDVYLGTAIRAGLAPVGATKQSHRPVRDMMKPVVLGISYGMGIPRMAAQLRLDTGDPKFTEEFCQGLFDAWNTAYPEWSMWREALVEQYASDGFLKSLDGWYLWGDNPTQTSVLNFPVQTAGSDILRRAIVLCHDKGLTISATLHDAIYVLADKEKVVESTDILNDCMVQAFEDYFIGHPLHSQSTPKTEAQIWGQGMEGVSICTKAETVVATDLHIEDKPNYDRYRNYFEKPAINPLLSLM